MGDRRAEDSSEGPGEREASTLKRHPAWTGHRDARGRRHAPPRPPEKDVHSPGALRGSAARARSHSHGPPSGSQTAPSLGAAGSRGGSSNKSSERLPGPGRCAHGCRSSAGPGCLRSTRGGGGCMWPLPPIHKSSAGHRWRAGLSRARRTGGRGLRRARRPQENKRARRASRGPAASSCVGLGAALRGPRRGGGVAVRSDGASCAAPSLGGAEPLRGSGHWVLAKESSGRLPSGQGHLQASTAAPSRRLSAALRRRVPAIWRRREPRHLRVCPSPGRAPALARNRGRARSGLEEGAWEQKD